MKKSILYTIYLIVSFIICAIGTCVLTYASVSINAECSIFAVISAMATVFYLCCIVNEGKKAGVSFKFEYTKLTAVGFAFGLANYTNSREFTILIGCWAFTWLWDK